VLNGYLILLDLVADVNEFLLVHPDKLQVLSGNIVVILLHLFESFLVVLHQVVDVLVFTLFDLMDLHFHAELKLIFELIELPLIGLN
jgi:hypothetical protein